MKSIILCADDYGQNEVISQAIVDLIEQNRLSATSCLTTSSSWPNSSKLLQDFKNKVDVGLHFNLTEGSPLSSLAKFYSLKEIIVKAYFNKLDITAITAELNAQLDRFIEYWGQLPDFIDGHQHIHQLPGVRDAVLAVYETRLRAQNTYLRCTYQPTALLRVSDVAYLKQLIIQCCGGIAFQRQLVERKIPHNTSFAGVYNFSEYYEYSDLFPRFVKQVSEKGLIMCHPALMEKGGQAQDPIANARHNEYLFFSSAAFQKQIDIGELAVIRFQ